MKFERLFNDNFMSKVKHCLKCSDFEKLYNEEPCKSCSIWKKSEQKNEVKNNENS